MPIYEYECGACGKRFEHIHQRFSDPPIDVCALCGGTPVRRLLSSPAIQFKGEGWYITDYARKGKSDAAGGETKTGKTEKSEKSDKAPESKSDSAPAKEAPASPPPASSSKE